MFLFSLLPLETLTPFSSTLVHTDISFLWQGYNDLACLVYSHFLLWFFSSPADRYFSTVQCLPCCTCPLNSLLHHLCKAMLSNIFFIVFPWSLSLCVDRLTLSLPAKGINVPEPALRFLSYPAVFDIDWTDSNHNPITCRFHHPSPL